MEQMNLLHKFYIKDKKARKSLFIPNRAQRDYLKNRTGRDYILKARQLGFTTLEQLRKLRKVLLNTNTTVATVAHERSKLDDIFGIARYAWDNLPEEVKEPYNIKYNNVRELYFGSDSVNEGSKYFVDLNMRSGTVHDLHVSELAKIKDIDDLFASTLEAVPKDGVITFETTANGLNQAHDLWKQAQEGKNEFTPHFYNWTWDDEYWQTPPDDNKWKDEYKILAKRFNLISDIQSQFQISDAQFYWYYLKSIRLGERTKQEYPTVPEEAFLASSISVFDLFKVNQIKAGNVVRTIRGVDIYEEPKVNHRYIIGCDTAEGVDGDRTAIEIWDLTDPENIVEVGSFSDASIRPDQTAELMEHLGGVFNEAFLIPERNSSGLTTVLKLQEAGYRNLFVNRQIDKRTQKTKNEYGWRTTSANRDLMIDDFIELFEGERLVINSPRMIQEMKTFVRKDNGRREHDKGYHDDSLFASFLAIQGNKFHRSARVFSTKAKAFQ